MPVYHHNIQINDIRILICFSYPSPLHVRAVFTTNLYLHVDMQNDFVIKQVGLIFLRGYRMNN